MEQDVELFSMLQSSASEKVPRFLLQKLSRTGIMGLWANPSFEERG